ncbi:putative disease resistance RPP13-like protein 1 [Vitis vinifera]|uniref:Putative disease resistance RPP13-like protein 1 n=1 Tax=Vitis vinifera TaxID=29760 RepID=A0A438C783_VITVI|nr:putative disease resistance RPP13-like protein 1 [Vitis vinifera]
MENVVSVNDASRANMKDKSYLDELIFDWGDECTNGVTQSGATTHDILNKLQPHPNLKQLSITNYPGEGFPNWLGDPSVLNLVSLELRGCGNCSTLPPLGQLTQLKYLQISRMNGVECVGDEFYGNASFQFLETLSFEDMQNWEKWLCCGEFPRLQKLFIRRCPKLTGKLPEQLLSLVELQIHECPQLLMASLTVPVFLDPCTKLVYPLTLKSLFISECSKLEILVPELFRCHLPVLESLEIKGGVIDDSLTLSFSLGIFPKLTDFTIDGLKGLEKLSILVSEGDPTSLCSLRLIGCSDLESIELHALNLESCLIDRCFNLRSLAHTQSSVQELYLCDCPELLFQREGLPSNLRILEIKKCNQLTPQVEWGLQRLTSLTRLRIQGGCEDIELFPKECLLPSSLTSLQIESFPDLKSLDSRGLQQLTSLLKLEIRNCPELQFPTGSVLQHLISLKELGIYGCLRLQSLTETDLQHLTSLQILRILYCPRLQSLIGSVLQHLTSLENLEIKHCPMLQSLTEGGLQHLTSLENLEIVYCRMLQSLTKVGLQHLTSLKTLVIMNCRKLKYLTKERLPDSLSFLVIDGVLYWKNGVNFEKGEEWRYIAHVPKIVINGRFLGAQHLMLIALFKKTKKLRGSVSAMSKAKGKAEAEDIMYKNRGISIETSPNDGTLCHPASPEIAAWPMARLTIPSTVKQFLMRCGDLFRRKSINEEVDIWHREKIEATDWELQQRKSVSPGPDSNLWQAFSEAGAQTTIASLVGPEMAITTNQPKKELLALKLGVLEQRVLQPPLLPALIFPDPPLEAIMPNCLLTQRRLRASWLLNLLNGLVSNLFGEVVSSWALLAIRDENRIQHLHKFPGFHGLLTNLYCSKCLDFQNERKLNPLSVIQNHLKPGHGISSSLSVQSSWTLSNFLFVNIQDFLNWKGDFSQWRNWRKGRFLGAELLMFIALFKKNKKLLNPSIELMLHNSGCLSEAFPVQVCNFGCKESSKSCVLRAFGGLQKGSLIKSIVHKKKTPVVSVHPHNSNAASVLDSYGEFGPSHSLLL